MRKQPLAYTIAEKLKDELLEKILERLDADRFAEQVLNHINLEQLADEIIPEIFHDLSRTIAGDVKKALKDMICDEDIIEVWEEQS